MAEPTVVGLLTELEEKAKRLHGASDSLNTILAQVEKRLVDANVGVEVWLRKALTSTDPEFTDGETSWTAQFLGFTKLNGRWCLAIKSVRCMRGFFEGDTDSPYQEEYKDGPPIALAKASRELRIAALEYMPDLIKLLSHEADRCIKTISHAGDLI